MKFWNTIPKPGTTTWQLCKILTSWNHFVSDPLYECQWAQGAFKADYTEDITFVDANTTSKCIRVCMSKKYYQRALVAYDISQSEPGTLNNGKCCHFSQFHIFLENGDYSIDSCTCQYSISEEPFVPPKAYDQQEFASALLTTCSKSETAGRILYLNRHMWPKYINRNTFRCSSIFYPWIHNAPIRHWL